MYINLGHSAKNTWCSGSLEGKTTGGGERVKDELKPYNSSENHKNDECLGSQNLLEVLSKVVDERGCQKKPFLKMS